MPALLGIEPGAAVCEASALWWWKIETSTQTLADINPLWVIAFWKELVIFFGLERFLDFI